MKTMHIGEMAKRFDLNPRTIRYYEAIGVMPESARTESGYRLYTQDAVERLEFILKSKSLGLTLNEIRKILTLHDKGVVPCEHTKDFIKHKIKEIEEKIVALASLKKTLSGVLKTRFKKQSAAAFCPLIEGADKKPLTLPLAGRFIV